MEGIQYLLDEHGKKTAVLINLKEYGEIWEDVYDTVVAQKREKDPRESLQSVRKRLQKQGKLRG